MAKHDPPPRGKDAPVSRDEFNHLRRRVGQLGERLDDTGETTWHRHVGSQIKAITSLGRVTGELLRVGRFNILVRLSGPLLGKSGGAIEFTAGDEVTISKGDISVLGPAREEGDVER